MLLRSVTRILADIDEVRETLAESASHPRGTLRVTAPAALSRSIRPGICEFQEKHPNVMIELNLTDRIVDILEEGYDVAIRTGPLPDSQLIAKRLAPKIFILASQILSDGGGPVRRRPSPPPAQCLVWATIGLALFDGTWTGRAR